MQPAAAAAAAVEELAGCAGGDGDDGGGGCRGVGVEQEEEEARTVPNFSLFPILLPSMAGRQALRRRIRIIMHGENETERREERKK